MPTTTTAEQKPFCLLTAAQVTLAYHALDWQRAEEMLADPRGAALLALLCNAAAKEAPAMYAFKYTLLRRAIELASDWWAAPHAYGDAYEADTVIYIENSIGRFSFHVRSSDPQIADLLADAPTSDRGWSGKPLQPIAKQLAQSWINGKIIKDALR